MNTFLTRQDLAIYNKDWLQLNVKKKTTLVGMTSTVLKNEPMTWQKAVDIINIH